MEKLYHVFDLAWRVIVVILAILGGIAVLYDLPPRLRKSFSTWRTWWTFTSHQRQVRRLTRLQTDFENFDGPHPNAEHQAEFYNAMFVIMYLIGAGLLSFAVFIYYAFYNVGNKASPSFAFSAACAFFTCSVIVAFRGMFRFRSSLSGYRTREKKTVAKKIEMMKKRLGLLYEIRFDYLPASPLENGWIRASKSDPSPRFTYEEIPSKTLIIETGGKVFSMDYEIPQEAKIADHIYINGRFLKDAIFYAEVVVVNKHNGLKETWWLAHVMGQHEPEKHPDAREWKFYTTPKNDEFHIDLQKEVRDVLGPSGQSFVELKRVRVRGDMDLRPIQFTSR